MYMPASMRYGDFFVGVVWGLSRLSAMSCICWLFADDLKCGICAMLLVRVSSSCKIERRHVTIVGEESYSCGAF